MSTFLVFHITRKLLEADLLTAVRVYSPPACLSMGDIAGSEAAKKTAMVFKLSHGLIIDTYHPDIRITCLVIDDCVDSRLETNARPLLNGICRNSLAHMSQDCFLSILPRLAESRPF
jgi:hypothetical protein